MGIPEGEREKVLRTYRAVCFVGAVVGVVAAAYFWSTKGPALGLAFVVLTVLLLPSYMAAAWAVRRGR